MKTFLKVIGIVLLGIVALAAIGVSYLALRKPAQRPASAEKIEATPERLARGEYLAEHVSLCVDCHSEHSTAYAIPIKRDRLGVGGFVWDKQIGFPGVVTASNLTPDPDTGLGNWTDGEILRAIREGVDRDGNALFPIMPYDNFRSMSDDDAKAIVVYLRTIKPQKWQEPAKKLDVPLNFVEKFVPKPLDAPVTAPDRSDHLNYGKYLTQISACVVCHTPKDDKDQPIPGKEFSGGWVMKTPWFRVVTANITPHPSTFMGRATKEEFIARFRAFANFTEENAPPAPKGRNTVMPWIEFSGMTDGDLGAIYDYLKTVPAIDNKVDPFPDAR